MSMPKQLEVERLETAFDDLLKEYRIRMKLWPSENPQPFELTTSDTSRGNGQTDSDKPAVKGKEPQER